IACLKVPAAVERTAGPARGQLRPKAGTGGPRGNTGARDVRQARSASLAIPPAECNRSPLEAPPVALPPGIAQQRVHDLAELRAVRGLDEDYVALAHPPPEVGH